MTRETFDMELKNLHEDLLKMSKEVEKQINLSVKSLIDKNDNIAEDVILNDDIIDRMQRDIEGKCITLIARQQPLAKDLRNIFTATKIVTDLERMADHAVDIAKIAKQLSKEKNIGLLVDIPKMAHKVIEIIDKSIHSYIAMSVDMAYDTCKLDDDIDEIYKKIFSQLLEDMSKDKDLSIYGTQFLFVCKFLERIADHATNICGWTVYLVTGQTIDLNE